MEYTKNLNKTLAFPEQELTSDLFRDAINASAIVPNCIRIDTLGDQVSVIFDADLSAGETTILNNLASAHHVTVASGLETQQMTASNSVVINSDDFIDMDDMQIIATETAEVSINFNASVSLSNTKGVLYYIISVAGVEIPETQRQATVPSNNDETPVMVSISKNVNKGDVIKVRWKQSGNGSITVTKRILTVKYDR